MLNLMRKAQLWVTIVLLLGCVVVSPITRAQSPELEGYLKKIGELHSKAKYTEALKVVEKAEELAKQELGETHVYFALVLSWRGIVYEDQGRYVEAELPFTRALEIDEKVLGPDHRDVATPLNNLAHNYGSHLRFVNLQPLLTTR